MKCADAAVSRIPPAAAAVHQSAAAPANAAGPDGRWKSSGAAPAAAASPAMPQDVKRHDNPVVVAGMPGPACFAAAATGRRAAAPARRLPPGHACRNNHAGHCAHNAGTAPCPPCFAAWREMPGRRPGRSNWLWWRDSSCAKNLTHEQLLARVDCSNPPQERHEHRTFWRRERHAVDFPFA